MASQPTPTVTSADVERVARRDFPEHQVAEVMAVLGEYGTQTWQREPDRVRLAVLKLAAGSTDRLRHEIEAAKRDYRDVLAPAEYPAYFKGVPGPGKVAADEEERIIEVDWKQYREWLSR